MAQVVVIQEPQIRVVEVTDEQITTTTTYVNKVVEVGIAGVQGPKGDKGDSADQAFRYTHTQGVASATWTINHNLDGFPNVTVVDSAGTYIEGDVTYVDADNITVEFSAIFSGKAYLS